jgi:hypothetical protein
MRARANIHCEKLIEEAIELAYNSYSHAVAANCCTFAVLGRKIADDFQTNLPIFGAFLILEGY